MSDVTEEPGHGNSPAAWAAVAIMLVGFAIATAALFLDAYALCYVGGALVVIGLIVGAVLKAAGFGVGGTRAGGHH